MADILETLGELEEEEQEEVARAAAKILQKSSNPREHELFGDLETGSSTPMAERAEDDTTAEIIESVENGEWHYFDYCNAIVSSYVDQHIDNPLWRENQKAVGEILERNGEESLAMLVEAWSPGLITGRNIYAEGTAVEEADSPEEYLEDLEKEYFQPI